MYKEGKWKDIRRLRRAMSTLEELARHNIDLMLELAGWSVQDMKGLAFTASRDIAIREFPLKTGFADYMLFVDR
jgi:type I restriction enzyme, R subunit